MVSLRYSTVFLFFISEAAYSYTESEFSCWLQITLQQLLGTRKRLNGNVVVIVLNHVFLYKN